MYGIRFLIFDSSFLPSLSHHPHKSSLWFFLVTFLTVLSLDFLSFILLVSLVSLSYFYLLLHSVMLVYIRLFVLFIQYNIRLLSNPALSSSNPTMSLPIANHNPGFSDSTIAESTYVAAWFVFTPQNLSSNTFRYYLIDLAVS